MGEISHQEEGVRETEGRKDPVNKATQWAQEQPVRSLEVREGVLLHGPHYNGRAERRRLRLEGVRPQDIQLHEARLVGN